MAQVVAGNTVKLNNGQTVQGQEGGWYDGQQLFKGTLSNPGQINANSNQQGAGQNVSAEVIKQTNPNNLAFIQAEQAKAGIPQTPSAGGGGGAMPDMGAGGGGGVPGLAGDPSQSGVLDLNGMYKGLYDSSGITDLEKQLSDKQQQATDTAAKINDNPWLSEGTRVGRVAKVNSLADATLTNLKNDIATKKADIETKMNIATKQFDINSQAATQSLARFNTLLQMGALDNASGEDIANITRSTGLSSGAIMAAVKASQDKNTPTSVIQYDDGQNQGFAVINTKTGAIISKNAVAASKPKSTGTSITNDSKQADLDAKLAPQYATQAAKAGKTLPDMLGTFQAYNMTPKQIYDIYAGVNYYKATPEQIKAAKKLVGVK